jgi:hypothetical protein
MKNSKLLEIIGSFSENELRAFDKFISSPFFERQRDVSGLFTIIKKFHPDYSNEALLKEKTFSKLFPGENYNEKKMKNLIFELTKAAEQFLVYNSIKNEPIRYDSLLAHELKKRKLDKPFLAALSLLEKKITELPFDGRSMFRDKEDWSYLKEDYLFWKNEYDESIKYRLLNAEFFILSFLIKLLQRMEDKVIITTRYNKEFKNPLLDTMIGVLDFNSLFKMLKERNYQFTWLLEIYYYCYKCSMDNIDNEEDYEKLKKLFLENIDFFSDIEKHLLFSDLTYFCIIRKERGELKYSLEEFEIYKNMLKYYKFNHGQAEYFHIVLYRNIVFSSVSQGEYEWLEKFANNFNDKLPPDLQENMWHYVSALLFFSKKEYGKALESANKIKYDIFLYKLDVKNLLIKIYYELDLFDQAISMIDAYKHFLSNNKEHTRIYHKHYGNFINFYGKLIKLKENPDVVEINSLKENIISTQNVASRQWLMEKISEIV